MSGVVDTNLLLFAANSAVGEHEVSRRFLEGCGRDAGLWFLTEGICYEFLRVATHARVFPSPLSAAEAMAFLDAILGSGRFEVLSAEPDHWPVLRGVLSAHPRCSGNLFFDIRTVALMKEHSVRTIYTADTDFLQFKDIEVINPLSDPLPRRERGG